MCLATPFAHQLGAGLQLGRTRFDEVALLLHGLRQIGDPPFSCRARPAQRFFLQLPGNSQFEDIASELLRRMRPVEFPPLGAKF